VTGREQALRAVDAGTLTPVARAILRDDTARVTTWTHEPFGHSLDGVYGTAPSIYRFSGAADTAGQEAAWSCVLKIVDAPETPLDPASPANGAREPRAYRSGLLNSIHGIRAPRCFGVIDRPEGGWWLWLENVADDIGRQWPRERYLLAARHLGHFNAAPVTGDRTSHAWLSRSPLRDAVAEFAPAVARLQQARQNSFVAQAISPESADALLRLVETIDARLTSLDALPQLLCHWDAHRANLTSLTAAGGRIETVAIDWANVGWGPAGAELSKLMSQTVNFFGVGAEELPALDADLFAHYVDGLRDGGWRGDTDAVRFGYTASAAARLIVRTASALQLALDDRARTGFERATGRSFATLADGFKATLPYYLSLVDEAERLSARS
jgi:hypothetical protein